MDKNFHVHLFWDTMNILNLKMNDIGKRSFALLGKFEISELIFKSWPCLPGSSGNRAGRGLMTLSGSDSECWTRFWLMRLLPVARMGGNPDHTRSA